MIPTALTLRRLAYWSATIGRRQRRRCLVHSPRPTWILQQQQQQQQVRDPEYLGANCQRDNGWILQDLQQQQQQRRFLSSKAVVASLLPPAPPLDDSDKETKAAESSSLESDQEQQQQPQYKRPAWTRLATRWIPQWLKTEPFCFERTVSALNVSLDRWNAAAAASGSGKASYNNMSLHHSNKLDLAAPYRKIYRDSIPSFMELILTTHRNNDNDNTTISESLQHTLDRLVDAGFNDSQFAKSFRFLKSTERERAQTIAMLQERQKEYDQRQRSLQLTIQITQERIDQMKHELTRLQRHLQQEQQEQEEATKTKVDISPILAFLSSAVPLAKPSEHSSTTSSTTTATPQQQEQQHVMKNGLTMAQESKTEERIHKLQRRIESRQAHVESLSQTSLELLESMQQLKHEYAQAFENNGMTEETYRQTLRLVNESLLVICDAFAEYLQQRHSTLIERYQNLDAKTDLTKPQEWYPMARLDKRKIIYHGGPTNSGKTYTALQRLKEAKAGLYLGPLRLLAAEIYETLNSQGVYTSLLTGQERREFAFSTHIAATVEMAGVLLDRQFDVVVIDEVQMIEDTERGFAWTRALLGLRSKEIHCCGGAEAVSLVQRLAHACNDDFEFKQYERFSKLTVAETSLASSPDQGGSYGLVQPGDCVVAFSRHDIFAIQREIEKMTNHKCCIIYGSLPPEVRTTQAQLFNHADSGYDVLVASDAISMGLNLNIRRIIFNSVYKHDGQEIVRLSHSAVKQIAGRAGRRNSPYPEGVVTCRDPRDLKYIQQCMKEEISPIVKAGLVPTAKHLEMFQEAMHEYHFGTTTDGVDDDKPRPQLHSLLEELRDLAVLKGDYFLCRQEDMVTIAKWLKDVELEIKDKFVFCVAPVNTDIPTQKDVMLKFGKKLAAGEVPGLTRGVPIVRARSLNDLSRLCSTYSEVDLFIWMQNKFQPVNLMELKAALARKESAAAMIKLGLEESERLKLDHCYVKRDATMRQKWEQSQSNSKEEDQGLEDSEGEGEDSNEHATIRSSF